MKKNLFNLLGVALAVIIAVIIFRKCSGCSGGQTIVDTLTVTKYIKEKTDTVFQPKPYAVIYYKPKYLTRIDSLIEFEIVDTAYILREFFATYLYSETIQTKYGTISIDDTVSENKIQSRGVRTDFQIPEVTKTIVVTQPKRNIVYLSISGQYVQPDNSLGIGGGLMWKFKNDMGLEAQYLINSHDTKTYQASVKIPIRLRRK